MYGNQSNFTEGNPCLDIGEGTGVIGCLNLVKVDCISICIGYKIPLHYKHTPILKTLQYVLFPWHASLSYRPQCL